MRAKGVTRLLLGYATKATAKQAEAIQTHGRLPKVAFSAEPLLPNGGFELQKMGSVRFEMAGKAAAAVAMAIGEAVFSYSRERT